MTRERPPNRTVRSHAGATFSLGAPDMPTAIERARVIADELMRDIRYEMRVEANAAIQAADGQIRAWRFDVTVTEVEAS